MAGKLIIDTIQTDSSFLQLNVGTTRIATMNNSGIYSNTGTKMIGYDGTIGVATVANTAIVGNITGSQLSANTVTGDKLGQSAVSSNNISANAVTQTAIASGVAGTGPAFSAYMSANQTVNHNTQTKVQFNTEHYDTNSCFNTSTYRFTPTVAGYYSVKMLLSYLAATSGSSNTYFRAVLYKNGTEFTEAEMSNDNYSDGRRLSCYLNCDIYMNGSTDYLEVYSFHYDYTSGAQVTVVADISAASKKSLFQAHLARAV